MKNAIDEIMNLISLARRSGSDWSSEGAYNALAEILNGSQPATREDLGGSKMIKLTTAYDIEQTVTTHVLERFLNDGGISLKHQYQRLLEAHEKKSYVNASDIVSPLKSYESWKAWELLEIIGQDIEATIKLVADILTWERNEPVKKSAKLDGKCVDAIVHEIMKHLRSMYHDLRQDSERTDACYHTIHSIVRQDGH